MSGILVLVAVVLLVIVLVLLVSAVPAMRRAARQADVLSFQTRRPVKGRHTRRSARHARARRIVRAH